MEYTFEEEQCRQQKTQEDDMAVLGNMVGFVITTDYEKARAFYEN